MDRTGQAHILRRRAGEVYVHYVNTDKRLDEWIPESDFRPAEDRRVSDHGGNSRKRKRSIHSISFSSGSHRPSADPSGAGAGQTSDHTRSGSAPEDAATTEEDYDIQHHKQITAQRNFDKVNFGKWQIKTW